MLFEPSCDNFPVGCNRESPVWFSQKFGLPASLEMAPHQVTRFSLAD